MTADRSSSELCFMSVADLSLRVKNREVSPVEVTRAVLGHIEKHDPQLGAYITVTAEVALQQATSAEAEISRGNYRGPLHGVTFSLKDTIATKGIRTSCGSMVNPDWVPDEDATVYRHLRDAGAILVGKANTREFGLPSINPAFPEPINPWHAERTPAGSSSGSAVSVAAGMAHCSIGSDAAGSGRAPASNNGVVGVKATFGRVSRMGNVPLSYSLDHITPLARNVQDAALVLQAISGHDPHDVYSSTRDVPNYSELLGRDISRLRIGIARGFTYEDIDPDVVNAMNSAYSVFRALGAEVTEVQLPLLEHCRVILMAIMNTEAAETHYTNLRESWNMLGPRARWHLALGNLISGTSYVHAQRIRRAMRDEYQSLLRGFDAIIGPASPTKPGLRGVTATTIVNGREIDNRDLSDGYRNIYNLTGLPAIVLGGGFSSEGTPIGLQIAAHWLNEPTMFQLAYAFEQATGWHVMRPTMPVAVI
jgi:aspartyl-tRNA(Asn)/glutamyl-tRNA(Gln) amidotransferase subunit A